MKFLVRLGVILRDQRSAEIVVEVDSSEDRESIKEFLYNQVNVQLRTAQSKPYEGRGT